MKNYSLYIYKTETAKNSHIDSYVCNFIQVHLCKYVCIFNPQGRTPLHIAVLLRHTQMVELLMEKRADPNTRAGDVSTNYI